MSTLDTGGFDFLLTLTAPTVTAAASAAFGTVTIPPRPLNTLFVTGTLNTSVRVTGASLPGGLDLTLTVDLTNTVVHVTAAALGGGPMKSVPSWMADVPIAGTVTITGRFTQSGAGGMTVSADFTTGGPYPVVVATLDPAPTLAAPLVTQFLASVIVANPTDPNAYTSTRDALLAMIRDNVVAGVTAAASSMHAVVATPPPSLPVVSLALLETPGFALTLAYTMGGSGGTVGAIGRLNVLTNTATGAPLDAVVLTLSNAGLLRDLVRPAAIGALGLPAGGFLPGAPFAWFGALPLPIPGGLPPGVASITVTSLLAGIDEAGRLHLSAGARVAGSGGTFTLTTTIDQAFTLGAAPAAGGFSLTATPAGPASVSSDVNIPAWVYAAGALSGGAMIVTVLAVIDLFAGTIISAPIGTAVTSFIGPGVTIPVPLPPSLPPLTPRLFTSFEADASSRSITIGSIITFAFPFRDHDLIVNLV